MMQIGKVVVACAAVFIALADARAGVIITYKDSGNDLQFDFSGTLNGDAFLNPLNSGRIETVALLYGDSPVFYSSPGGVSYLGQGTNAGVFDTTVTHTAGFFATNLPDYNFNSPSNGTSSGTGFGFRLFTSPFFYGVEIFGNWGAANSLIDGRFIMTGQSAAGIGMVDGWTLNSRWGSITFQEATSDAVVPEPTSLAIFGIGTCVAGLGTARRRRG